MLDTPILFLVFNRPATTRSVFETIRQARPKQLFIAADGPRPDKPDDTAKCAEVRQIVSQVDWDCEVKTLLRQENLGCGRAVSQAITWFFNQVEGGIILEDDTLPNQSFFKFCETLLKFYNAHEHVMHISGTNFLEKKSSEHSYYCSRYPNIWGWASWARAWKGYSLELDAQVEFNKLIRSNNPEFTRDEINYWHQYLDKTRANANSTWDYQWYFHIWQKGGLCITSNFNLVANIGFGEDSTHTSNPGSEIANIPKFEVAFPLKHVKELSISRRDDYCTFKKAHGVPTTFSNKMRNLSYRIISYEKRKRYFGI